jgi:hypothetical protein
MGVLKAYADESGKANDPKCPAISMAAVIGEVQQWHTFSGLWNAMLQKHEIPYLHMKEIIGGRHTKRGVFAKYSDSRLLSELLKDAVGCILQANLYSCAVSVFVDDLEVVLRRHRVHADPLSFTIFLINMSLGTWALNNHPENPSFHLVLDRMEKGTTKIAQAEKLYDESAFLSWRGWPAVTALRADNRQGSRELVELQAADLVAWSVRNHLLDIRYWMQTIKPTIPGYQPEAWNESLQKWLFARLNDQVLVAPEKIVFYRVIEALKIRRRMTNYNYDEERIETHIFKHWNHTVHDDLRKITISRAGRETPLTP